MKLHQVIFLFLFIFSYEACAEDLLSLQMGKSELLYLDNCKAFLKLDRDGEKLVLDITSKFKCGFVEVDGKVTALSRRILSGGFIKERLDLSSFRNKNLSVTLYSNDREFKDVIQVVSGSSIDDQVRLSRQNPKAPLFYCKGSVSFEEKENDIYLIFADVENCNLVSLQAEDGNASSSIDQSLLDLHVNKKLRIQKQSVKGIKSVLVKVSGTIDNPGGLPLLIHDKIFLDLEAKGAPGAGSPQ